MDEPKLNAVITLRNEVTFTQRGTVGREGGGAWRISARFVVREIWKARPMNIALDTARYEEPADSV